MHKFCTVNVINNTTPYSSMEKEIKKIVLTGGPSSGKSTLVKELERRGYQILHEIARNVLEERKYLSPTKEEWVIRQNLIYQRQLDAEELVSGLVFLDRGTIDTVAYSKYYLGYVPFELVKNNYSAVFNLERLPFVNDGLRAEKGEEEAKEIHNKILETYTEFGHKLICIPTFPSETLEESVSKRADHLLSKLEEILI
jgi:predicted ATPase